MFACGNTAVFFTKVNMYVHRSEQLLHDMLTKLSCECVSPTTSFLLLDSTV